MTLLGVEAAALLVAAAAFVLGGFVKGAVGFALPLIAVTLSASVLPARTAVALVILPVLISNVPQAFAQGRAALTASWRRFRPLVLATVIAILLTAPLLPAIDDRLFFALLGLGSGLAAAAQLVGWRPRIAPRREAAAGVATGLVGGFFGGLAGIWGPPTMLYLGALGLGRDEQVRAAGLVFMVGGFVLAPAHVLTGVLDATTAPLSALMLAPTFFGQWLGVRARARLDLELFRTVTLWVLVLSAANLLRRAWF